MKHNKWLFAAFFGLSWITSVRADIAPDPMSGGISLTELGDSRTEVSLVHNTVKIWVSPTLSRTRAFFRLRNTGTDVAFEAGFPLVHKGEAPDFQVFIDGKKQEFKDREEEKFFRFGTMQKKVTQRWKVWPMRFAANQTCLVEVRYSNVTPDGFSHSLPSNGFYPAARRLRERGDDYDVADFGFKESLLLNQWIAIKTVRYVLVSGSYWKGPIERCRIEMNVENLAPDAITDVLPPPRSISAQAIVWQWNNVEPSENIAVTFFGASPRKTIIPYLRKIAEQHPEDQAIVETLDLMQKDFPIAKTTAQPSAATQ